MSNPPIFLHSTLNLVHHCHNVGEHGLRKCQRIWEERGTRMGEGREEGGEEACPLHNPAETYTKRIISCFGQPGPFLARHVPTLIGPGTSVLCPDRCSWIHEPRHAMCFEPQGCDGLLTHGAFLPGGLCKLALPQEARTGSCPEDPGNF